MGLITQEIEITLNNKYVSYYKNLGYENYLPENHKCLHCGWKAKNRRTYGDSLVKLVSIETTTQESTGLALCERQF